MVRVLLGSFFPDHSLSIPASSCLDIPPKAASEEGPRPRPRPRPRYNLRRPANGASSPSASHAPLTMEQFSSLVLQPFVIGSLIREDERNRTGSAIPFADALELARTTESIGEHEREDIYDGLELSAEELVSRRNERKLQEWKRKFRPSLE